MAPIRNARLLFNQPIESGYPVVGETLIADNSGTIDLESVPLDGGVLIKTLSLSLDPYMRGKMHAKPPPGYYGTLYEVGKPIYSLVIGKVLRSEDAKYQVGDYTYGAGDFVEYQVVAGSRISRKLPKDSGVPWSAYLGVAGMPGQTAYYGWKEIADAKKGETAYISTAAGAVGSLVVQLAKKDGLKVIGSAGQEDKLQFLRELGADVVFNYKQTDLNAAFKEHGPIDIYWDHVGNETLETVLNHMNTHGRVVVIGSAASYNSAPYAIKNFNMILYKQLKVQGMLVNALHHKYAEEFYREVPPMIARGEIKYTESIVRSLDDAGQLFLDLMQGHNSGKAVVVLADD